MSVPGDTMAAPQPDQQPALWDRYVAAYERVFEPLSDRFATAALDRLGPLAGRRLIDVGAGAGGAALRAASSGADVLAIDAAPAMTARLAARAASLAGPGRVRAETMDGNALQVTDGSFDLGLSVFGVILFPDPAGALRELRRVLVPGGRVAVVTWTRPDRYELIGRLIAASAAVRGPQPAPSGLPAQLRFREEPAFRALLAAGGFAVEAVIEQAASLTAPSARALAADLAFAPGIAALLADQGEDRAAVLERFVADLERDQGTGPVALEAIALIGLARAG
ncbi:MAG: methyltransferase domain-containing protein [Methylobacteriaceae bacterium]|nr:methyltransferase domain-containing protein [Methylobacteriaceae bacterium]